MVGVAAGSGNRAGRSLVGRRLGRYEVLAKLASGGMAAVYVARAKGVAGFERLVAIKILHPNLAHEQEFVSMFLDEAKLAARIRHPNVVPMLDISDTVDAGYFVVMEYIEGDHLGQLLAGANKLNHRLPQPSVMRIVVDALSGLGAAHKLSDDSGKPLNLVHRDVSPHNIMVGLDGISRLTDFGVAKAEDRLTHTRDGRIKGKLSYMAPEQASVARTDPRSDLFSIGIILWESLTGTRLFRSETTAGTLNKLVSEPIPMPSSTDPTLSAFDPVLKKALSRNPEARFQSADDFVEALEKLAPQVGGMASLRDVGKVVEKFASKRISADKKRIKDAIQTLGSAQYAPASRQAGAYDVVSESSSGFGTGSSVSSVSRSAVSGHNSALSKRSGVPLRQTSPSAVVRSVPLRPPLPPPRRPSTARSDEKAEISGAYMEQSEPSAMSASQLGPHPVWQGRLLAVLAVCCVVLAGVVVWAMLREPEPGGVRVIRMETESVPATPVHKPAPPGPRKPSEPPKPAVSEQEGQEQAASGSTEETATEPPETPFTPKPIKSLKRPRKWSKGGKGSQQSKRVEKSESDRPAATASKGNQPVPLKRAGVAKPSAGKGKRKRRSKPKPLDKLDLDNPYR